MNYIIFGGSGFIGTHLIHLLKETHPEDKIYDLDIVMPGEEGVVPGIVEKNEGVIYERVDVRKPITFEIETTERQDTKILSTLKQTYVERKMLQSGVRNMVLKKFFSQVQLLHMVQLKN